MVALLSLKRKTCTLDGKYCSQRKVDLLAPLEMGLLLCLQYFVFVTLYAENAFIF